MVVNDNNQPRIQVKRLGINRVYSAEDISSMILADMKTAAEKYLGATVTHAVVTVPAYFSNNQRVATERACNAVRLTVLRIINEPTAAAIAYNLTSTSGEEEEQTEGRYVLIFDLGGGTLNVSIVSIINTHCVVMSTSECMHLGGRDFDTHLVNHCAKEFERDNKTNVTANLKAMCRLRTECEEAKRYLMTTPRTRIYIPSFADGQNLDITIGREQFNKL